MVHFVGAGPGAPDLITVRGAKLLENAGTIIYAGSLVNPALLDYAGENCRIYDSAVMTLEEVMDVIINSKGDVVRLHTGDPSVYGAIKEQMDILDRKGIEYDICPGVSSMSAAAAVLKAEYTLPGVSQSVIITRAQGRTAVPLEQELKAFAGHGSTMVIFLSAGLADRVQEELKEGGYKDDTPVAVVYKATWPEEKTVRTRLCDLAVTMKKEDIDRTALIIVGDVLDCEYELSKLYDKNFTTGYRHADKGDGNET